MIKLSTYITIAELANPTKLLEVNAKVKEAALEDSEIAHYSIQTPKGSLVVFLINETDELIVHRAGLVAKEYGYDIEVDYVGPLPPGFPTSRPEQDELSDELLNDLAHDFGKHDSHKA